MSVRSEYVYSLAKSFLSGHTHWLGQPYIKVWADHIANGDWDWGNNYGPGLGTNVAKEFYIVAQEVLDEIHN